MILSLIYDYKQSIITSQLHFKSFIYTDLKSQIDNQQCWSYSFNHLNLLRMKNLKCYSDDALANRENIEYLKQYFWENFNNRRDRRLKSIIKR